MPPATNRTSQCDGCHVKIGWTVKLHPCVHSFHPRCFPNLPIDCCPKCSNKAFISYPLTREPLNINKYDYKYRKGYWSDEEKLYAKLIIEGYDECLFPLPPCSSIRGTLSLLLHCERWRITRWKKIVLKEKKEVKGRVIHKSVLWRFMKKFSTAEKDFLKKVRRDEGGEFFQIVAKVHEAFWNSVMKQFIGPIREIDSYEKSYPFSDFDNFLNRQDESLIYWKRETNSSAKPLNTVTFPNFTGRHLYCSFPATSIIPDFSEEERKYLLECIKK